MNRRRVLTALAGLGLTGGSLWVAERGVPSPGVLSDDSPLPVRVATIDAPGSERGHASVPVPGTVTVVDLFATWCTPCVKQMAALRQVHREYGDQAAFVSVTNERLGGTLTRADIRAWWRRHDGAWTVGIDPESDLMRALGARGLPHLVVADERGRPVWEHEGVADAETIARELERVL